jgi:2-oxoglutarate ferredoxin oxidoreductase subunit beta
LSSCPVNWGKTPIEALRFIKEAMIPYYPLGDYKVGDGVKGIL